MKRFLPLLALVLSVAFGVPAAHAQTYAVGTQACHMGQLDCYAVPMTDGTNKAEFWLNLASGSWIAFMGLEPSLGLVTVTDYKTTTATYKTPDGKIWTGTVPQSVSFTFKGEDGSYAGSAAIVFGHYFFRDLCRGCTGWYWSVEGGSITINP